MRKIDENIRYSLDKEKALRFLEEIKGKRGLFLCVGGSSETAKIPGISMAGKNPELTDYTPPTDLEIITRDDASKINEIPTTPEGIPTPALLTKSALDLGNTPVMAVNSGMKVKPDIPTIDINKRHGNDITKKKAVKDSGEIYQNARLIGKNLGKTANYLIIGETLPGGTTTALGVLEAMGIDAEERVSSSMPDNPHEKKVEVVREGLKNSGLEPGELRGNPLEAIEAMGDPMIPAVSGLVSGASMTVPTVLAGGTQMTAVLKVLVEKNPKSLENISIWTTKWVIEDGDSDLIGLIREINKVPVLAVDMDLSSSKHRGLKKYEEGFVKEGAGAGGAMVDAIQGIKSKNCKLSLLDKIDKTYEKLVK